ncbi:MAG: response regulator transcription factor [Oscillospiraceae bacterium]
MPNQYTVLIVEDELAIRNFISAILTADDYLTLQATSGRQAEQLIHARNPDVILLDLGLPDMDGADILRKVRQTSDTPVIVVSAREHEKEKVAALDLGADDYIVKPFGSEELLARIRAAIRHHAKLSSGEPTGIFQCGDLSVDFDRRLVQVDGQDTHLTQIEYRILTMLCQRSGHVISHEAILKNVWGPYAPYDIQILRVNMANIRRKLEHNPAEPHYILTEVGVGYRMSEGTYSSSQPT